MSAASKERFEAIAMPHLDAVHRMACALAGNEAEVDDLVQETFIRGFRAFNGFELREYGARPWLFRILHNVFYTSKTRERRAPTLLDDVDFDNFEDELADGDATPMSASAMDWDQFDDEVKRAVLDLQPEYRFVLLLWAIEGLTYREIADVCNCAMGTIMSRLYRGRQLLGRRLRNYAREHRFLKERDSI